MLAAFAFVAATGPGPADFAAAHDAFGIRFLRHTAILGKNTVVSPNCVLYALAGLYPASTGETRRELARATGMGDDKGLSQLLPVFQPDSKSDRRFESAAAAWIDDAIRPNGAYVDALAQDLEYSVTYLDLQSGRSLQTINAWVHESTNGKIPQILNSIPREAVLVLTSALYVKSVWEHKTQPMDRPLRFTAFGSVQFSKGMCTTASLHRIESPTFEAVSIPLKGGLAAEIYLPARGSALELVADGFLTARPRFPEAKVPTYVEMPFWNAEFFSSIVEPLRKSGLAAMFERRGELAQIHSTAFVAETMHRTRTEFNDRGIEASAATAVVVGGFGGGSVPPPNPKPFIVDRPFFYVLRDTSTGAALFMGFIYEPTRA